MPMWRAYSNMVTAGKVTGLSMVTFASSQFKMLFATASIETLLTAATAEMSQNILNLAHITTTHPVLVNMHRSDIQPAPVGLMSVERLPSHNVCLLVGTFMPTQKHTTNISMCTVAG